MVRGALPDGNAVGREHAKYPLAVCMDSGIDEGGLGCGDSTDFHGEKNHEEFTQERGGGR